eukprot:TRINITY_DN13049_c0_g1_i1.p1 TRINITY_DN13049_c0_g1~~TRINITY_DN13049_c0_g1_i1.p1  ORF type:complete len:228 (-),score=-11.11 TRINITY_DN13049_c0_g1_i1:435-1118(-)
MSPQQSYWQTTLGYLRRKNYSTLHFQTKQEEHEKNKFTDAMLILTTQENYPQKVIQTSLVIKMRKKNNNSFHSNIILIQNFFYDFFQLQQFIIFLRFFLIYILHIFCTYVKFERNVEISHISELMHVQISQTAKVKQKLSLFALRIKKYNKKYNYKTQQTNIHIIFPLQTKKASYQNYKKIFNTDYYYYFCIMQQPQQIKYCCQYNNTSKNIFNQKTFQKYYFSTVI